jgi:hypothetical protein
MWVLTILSLYCVIERISMWVTDFCKLEGQFYDEEGQNKVGYHFPNVILYKVDNLLVPKVERTQII